MIYLLGITTPSQSEAFWCHTQDTSWSRDWSLTGATARLVTESSSERLSIPMGQRPTADLWLSTAYSRGGRNAKWGPEYEYESTAQLC